MARAVGVDLGTTYSAVAAVRRGGLPELLWNREGDLLTPSVLLLPGADGSLVGKSAKHATKDVPGDCVELVKRRTADPGWTFTDSQGGVRGEGEIRGLILRRLAEDATGALGEPVREVVLAAPAHLGDAGRRALLSAGQAAGLRVARLIDEAVAASLAFGVTTGTLLVYDLGGGTLKVSVLAADGAEPKVVAHGVDRELGGFDFDTRLMEFVASEVRKLAGPDLLDGGRREAELRERCEQAKHALSRAFQTRLFFRDADRGYTVEVGRERFERMTSDLLARTQAVTEEVLAQAGVGWSSIDRILLVGGSTRMPMVRRMIERRLGSMPDTTVDPGQAVALGTAIATRDPALGDRRRPAPRAGGPVSPRPVHRRGRVVRRRDGELL
jgi:molecular chaperone DnaK